MYSLEKPPRDPCHLSRSALVEDPHRAGGIGEDFEHGEDGPTLLLQGAARLGDIDRMSMAIEAGASLSAKDSWGLAPIHSTALIGCTVGIDLLIKSRARIDEISLRGQTALHLAAAEGKDGVLMQLLSLKADVAFPTSFGSTALAIAERRRRAAAIAAHDSSTEAGPAELALRAELTRRLEFAEVEEFEKRKQYADAVAAREHLEAQLGTMLSEVRCAMNADDEADVEEEVEASTDVVEPTDAPCETVALEEQPGEEKDDKEPSRSKSRLKTVPPSTNIDEKPKATPRTNSLPGSLMEAAAALAEESPPEPTAVGKGYEYWRATKIAMEEARTKGEDALKRSWLRDLPSAKDSDIFPWTGELRTTQCLAMPDPEDDVLVNGYEWLLEVAREEEARNAALKQQSLLLDGGESLVQKTRDEAMLARTGATQQEWESRLQELKDNNYPWDWSTIEVRQRSVSSEALGSAGVFAVSSTREVVFEENDVIGPLSGTIRRRSRYEELYYSGHNWTLHDPMSFQMSLQAQTAELKTERLVMDLRAGRAQNRLRYLSDVRLDPMGLHERLGLGNQPSARSVLSTRTRMQRPRSRPGSPETDRSQLRSQAAAISSTPQVAPSSSERRPNATWVEVLVDGWPHVFVVATRQICVEQEIIVDYGEEYWAAQRVLFSRFLDMGQLGDETVVRVNGVERDAEAYRESLSARKEHWQWQRDRLEKEWK